MPPITLPPGQGATASRLTPQQASEPTLAMNATGAVPTGLNITVSTPAGPQATALRTPGGGTPVIPDVELQSELGRGGMGVVYRGRQPYLDRRVAVKLLLVDPARGGEDFVKRFQREAKILAGLHHPHIVACYQAGVTAEGAPYLVMEFIDGPNLKDHVARNGPLSVRDAVGVIADMAEALGHANAAGIIHRDVKPENILLASKERSGADSLSAATATTTAGAPPTATATSASARAGTVDGAISRPFPYTSKLVDLGLARPSAKGEGGEMHLTMQGVLMGTPSTMAPEQFDDPDHVDFRADIYGLGCVLFHSLTGCAAFEAKSLGEILSLKVSGKIPDAKVKRPDLPPEVCDLLRDLLAHKRDQRPQDYPTLIARCRAIQGGKPVPGAAGGIKPMYLVAAFAVVLVGAMGAGFLFAPKPAPPAPIPPVVVAPPADPTPTPAPADTGAKVVYGAAQPLVRPLLNERLKDWTIDPDALWAPSEETEGGITITNGAITRPLQAAPFKIEGTVALANDTIKCDQAVIGVVLANGNTMALSVRNLGSGFTLSIDLVTPGPDSKLFLQDSSSLPADKLLPFTLEVAPRRLAATIDGNELPPVGLASEPKSLVLAVKNTGGKGPAEFAKLTVSYPAK